MFNIVHSLICRFIQKSVAGVGPLPTQLPVVAGVAMGSLVGGLLVVYSCQKAPPPLVAVVRSSEILLAVFADYVIFRTSSPDALRIAGSGVTLVSVALMAASDWIQAEVINKRLLCQAEHHRQAGVETTGQKEEPLLTKDCDLMKTSSQHV